MAFLFKETMGAFMLMGFKLVINFERRKTP